MVRPKKDSKYEIPITEVQIGDKLQPLFLRSKSPNIPSNLSDKRLREITEDAIYNGYVHHGDLIYILTMDEQYPDEIIQRLWQKYHHGKQHEETLRFRLRFWIYFLNALAFRRNIPPNRIFNGLEGVPILPLSYLDKDTGKVVEFNRKINPYGNGALIRLEDLKKYFTETLRIPLPSLLFSYHLVNTNESDLIKSVKNKSIEQEDNAPELSDWYISEPDFTQNPTDRNIYVDSIYAGPVGPRENPFENEVAHLCQYGTFTEVWLKNIYKNATVLGALRSYELANYLALEDVYDDVLPILWEYCGFNDDPNDRFPKWDQKMLSDAHSRARVWYWILSRWTTYNYFIDGGFKVPNYYFHQLKSAVKLLPLYKYENDFEKVHENEPQSCKQYIKLNEFREYLLQLQDNNISVPLPSRLFPKDNETASIRSNFTNCFKNEEDYESFIKKIKVSYESDDSFKIQTEHGKPWRYINRQSWSHKKTKSDKIWNDFLSILQSGDRTYYFGSAKDRTEYEKKRERLSEMNKKLINLFNKEFGMNIPTRIKMYERCHDKNPGTYKFKFQVTDHVDVELADEEIKKRKTLEKIEKLGKLYRNAENKQQQAEILSMLSKLSGIALEKKWMDTEDFNNLLSSKDEEILFDKNSIGESFNIITSHGKK